MPGRFDDDSEYVETLVLNLLDRVDEETLADKLTPEESLTVLKRLRSVCNSEISIRIECVEGDLLD